MEEDHLLFFRIRSNKTQILDRPALDSGREVDQSPLLPLPYDLVTPKPPSVSARLSTRFHPRPARLKPGGAQTGRDRQGRIRIWVPYSHIWVSQAQVRLRPTPWVVE